jgi:hypothetical protein
MHRIVLGVAWRGFDLDQAGCVVRGAWCVVRVKRSRCSREQHFGVTGRHRSVFNGWLLADLGLGRQPRRSPMGILVRGEGEVVCE